MQTQEQKQATVTSKSQVKADKKAQALKLRNDALAALKLMVQAVTVAFVLTNSDKKNVKASHDVDFIVSMVNNICAKYNKELPSGGKLLMPWELMKKFASGKLIDKHVFANGARKRYYERLFSKKSRLPQFAKCGVDDITDKELKMLIKTAASTVVKNSAVK